MFGRVIKSTGSWYTVKTPTGYVQARLRGKFKQADLKLTNPIAAGDKVEVEIEGNSGNMVITEILPRENYIIRKSPRKVYFTHIIASNIDQAFLMVTVSQPRTSLGFIDRFLVSAESFRIPVTIIVNKADLIRSEKEKNFLAQLREIYVPLGYPVLEISSLEDEDLRVKVGKLIDGKSTLLSGHSGVGKSTLLNKLIPNAQQNTKEISKFSAKGVHTTTFAEMFEWEGGGYLIDTPGIKEFGILDIDEFELSHYFVEMRAHLGKCRYNNCRHVNEPGCMIRQYVEDGKIHPLRYENYLKILFEEETHK